MRETDIDLPDRRLRVRWINEEPAARDDWEPTIVFLHEGLGSIELWRQFPEDLCRRTGLRGFLYDRTGYGRSSAWPSPPGTRHMQIEGDEILPQLLDAAGIGPCLLIGHSEGGTIALNFASCQPAMLRGVVTIGAHVVVESRTLSSIRQARQAYRHQDLRIRLERYHGVNVDGVFNMWSGAWLSTGFEPMAAGLRLPRIRVPVLALQGEHDEYGTLVQLAALSGGVSGRCETRVLPGCGHGPHLQDPPMVVEIVARFVETLGRGPGSGARRIAGVAALVLACVLGTAIPVRAQAECDGPEVAATLEEARDRMLHADDAAAAALLRAAPQNCRDARTAAFAVAGWMEARRLALLGGAPSELGAVTRLLDELDALASGLPPTALDAQACRYAQAVVRAAIAAAQDERGEMAVYLQHARGLAASLVAGDVRLLWPLPIDIVEGELWLEVDRYAEARAAFERSGAASGARAALGLARVLRRQGDHAAACSAYGRALSAGVGPEATRDAENERARLKCEDR